MKSVCSRPLGFTAAAPAAPRLREAFLGTVAAGALSLAFGGPALALLPVGCSISGGNTIETCIGDQHAGVAITGPTTLTTLNVNSLTAAITPMSGTAGISFTSTDAVTINSNTGAFGITTSNANGINAIGSLAVTVTSTGNIATKGTGTLGIFAAGVGTGAVTVTSIGNIATTGTGAFGIVAENLGAGAVTVTSSGNITASGSNDASGIAAGSAGGPITITVKSGTVSGGSGISAGVVIAGGTNNTLTNMGTVTALSGVAILGEVFTGPPGGNNTVNNFGTVTGSVVLDSTRLVDNMILGGGGGANTFNNMAGGLFNSGATVSLGAGNTLTNAGTLSPGGVGVIQTTALSGNLVQSATGRLLTDINIGGATSDRINVSGTANLAGAVQLQISNLTLAPWQQTIVSAAGGTTINGLTLSATSPVLQAQLVYPNATDVVVKSSGINFLTPDLNSNQTSIANALNGAAFTAGLGGPIFSFLLNGITSLPAYSLALNQFSGEAATGSQQTTFDAMNLFMGTMLDPSNRGTISTPGGGASGYASEGSASGYASTQTTSAARDAYAMFTKAPPVTPFEQRWSVWAAGFGGSQTTDGNATLGSNNTTSSVYGTAVGADYRISPYTIAGFALAGGGTNFSVAGSGSGHSDLFQAGAFIRHEVGAAYISAALAYGWQDITTNRTQTVAGFDQLQAKFNANAFSGRLEGGYRFVAPWVGGLGITPYAAAQFTTFDLPAYAEQATVGSNAFALAYDAKDVTDTRSELGIRTDKSWAMTDGILTLRGRVAWAHDYDPDRSIAANFQTLPGASFVVNGAAQAADSALVTASVEKKWLNGWSAAATFEGEFSDVTRSYAGKGVVRYQW